MFSRIRLSFFALAMLTSFSLALSASAQTVYKGHIYQLTTTAENWTNAEAEAVTLGGHLVAINDLSEQNFINTTFLSSPHPFWIGLTDIGHQGAYSTWTNGEPVTYTNWKSGEPNNAGGNEDYITVNWDYSRGGTQGTWNDTPLNGTVGYSGNTTGPYFGIIERPVTVPAPSAMLTALIGVVPGVLMLRRRKSSR